MGWRDKSYECAVCGWQGMQRAAEENICPECGSNMTRRSWLDTWGLTILILSAVVGTVLFVGYFGQP